MFRGLTQERLKHLLHYDEKTDTWTWRNPQSKRVKKGDKAGCIRNNKYDTYLLIGVDGYLYMANRLAFFYLRGEWPERKPRKKRKC